MPSEPASYPFIRVAIVVGCALLGLAAMVLVGVAVDAPMWAMAHGVRERFGGLGLAIALALLVGAPAWLAYSGNRRDERRQAAETGVLDHKRPLFVREGLARNLAMLLAPLAILVLIGLGFWLTGTPFPSN